MWVSQIPDDPIVASWWRKADARAAEEEAADARRAERIERLRARFHEIDMRLAGALSADRQRRIQRRAEERSTARHGYVDESESYRGLPVEHSNALGRVLSVR